MLDNAFAPKPPATMRSRTTAPAAIAGGAAGSSIATPPFSHSKIAGSSSQKESTGSSALRGFVGIRMVDSRPDGGQDHALIAGQIKLDAWQRVRRGNRAAIADLALAGEGAVGIPVDFEFDLARRNLNAGFGINPRA